jgi:cytoskeletal protein RodZ
MVRKAIGQLLKEQRTKLDWSLDEAESVKEIKKIYISALETDNYKIFPSSFYVRAYLKQYVERLDLDEEVLLKAFDEGTDVEIDSPIDDTANYRFIRPDQRSPEQDTEEEDEDEEKGLFAESEADQTQKSWAARNLPTIFLSSVAIIILLSVGITALINLAPLSHVKNKNYYLASESKSSSGKNTSDSSQATSSSQSTTSTSSSNQDTTMNVIQNGNYATVMITTKQNPVTLDLSLLNPQTSASVAITSAPQSSYLLNATNKEIKVSLNKGSYQSLITVNQANLLAITINGQVLTGMNFQMPVTSFNLEITYQ